MNWFAIIKMFYNDKLWSKAMVWDAVDLGKITREQYKEITGDNFPIERPLEEVA